LAKWAVCAVAAAANAALRRNEPKRSLSYVEKKPSNALHRPLFVKKEQDEAGRWFFFLEKL